MTWTRRHFLGSSALGLIAAGFPRLLTAAAYGPLVELRRNVGLFAGRGGTMGWLANTAGSVVVDSQFPDTAGEFLAELEQRSTRPVAALINTHHHGDHTAGNGVIGAKAGQIVAHARVPELQQRAAESNASPATQTYAGTTFEREWSLDVGDETVHAKHYGPAHTGGDSAVFFERANIVHMGDLVFNRAYPFIDRPGGASVAGWVDVLESIAGEHDADTIYIFGHARQGAQVTGGRADVLVQRDFLGAVLESVRRSIAAGESREQATSHTSLPGFGEHAAIAERLSLGAVLGVAYDELTGAER